MSEADTLKLHVYDRAMQHHVRVLNEAAIKSGQKILPAILKATTENGGLLVDVSNAFWSSSHLSDSQKMMAIKIRFRLLLTRAKLAQFYPGQGLSEMCELCHL